MVTQIQATRQKTALAPDLRALPDRSARAWAEEMAVWPLGDARYAVAGEHDATYVVDLEAGSCTCPDHRIRGNVCKHLRRVALEITSGRVPPPGTVFAECAACGTEMTTEESTVLPLCELCTLDPGEVVLDRETGDRLVVRELLPTEAHETEIPSADTTVADYPTNDGYPTDDLVVEAVYARDVGSRGEPREYRFPRSRLRRADDAELIQ